MKKYILLTIISIVTLVSCEQDNICVEATTPNLSIRFYDYTNPTSLKDVIELTVWAAGKDSLYIKNTTDSISMPLDVNKNFTYYILATEKNIDTIKFSYNRNDIYVSRSCGYKTIFEEFTAENNTSTWIKQIEIINTIINNDTAAQVNIYH